MHNETMDSQVFMQESILGIYFCVCVHICLLTVQKKSTQS